MLNFYTFYFRIIAFGEEYFSVDGKAVTQGCIDADDHGLINNLFVLGGRKEIYNTGYFICASYEFTERAG